MCLNVLCNGTLIGLELFISFRFTLNSLDLSLNMPRPTINHSPSKKAFICSHCNRKFQSKAGCTRHINAKHHGLQANSPQSTDADSSEVENSSCPGSPSPALPSHIFDTPLCDAFNDENDFNFGNDDIDMPQSPPLSPLQDTPTSMFTEHHPYLNGK